MATVLLMMGCGENNLKEQLDKQVPAYAEVGVQAMQDSILPIASPFFSYNFERPSFPDLTDTLRSNDSLRIQSAIDRIANAGGGMVYLSAGEYRSGRIELKSNVHLYLAEGAVIIFGADIADFLPVVFTRNEGVELYSLGACIYANDAKNIAITGKGKLVGPGEGSVRKTTMTHDVIEKLIDHRTPVEERVYDGRTASYIFPPALIAPIHCKDVFIEGVSLERSAFWNIVPTYCDGVIIRGVTVRSEGIQRGDGIDIESSRNVLVEYCSLFTGDDCIAIKAGRGEDGLRTNRPSENVVVRYCLAGTGHGGITIGSETAGMIKNLHVHDCAFDGTDVGIRFKTRRPRGGGGKDILIENIRMNVVHSAIRWDMLGQALHVGQQADRNFVVEPNALTPHFSDTEIRNIIIESAGDCIKAEGIPESPLTGIKITNVYATGERYLSICDARDFHIRQSVFHCKETAVDTLNVVNLTIDNVALFDRKK